MIENRIMSFLLKMSSFNFGKFLDVEEKGTLGNEKREFANELKKKGGLSGE